MPRRTKAISASLLSDICNYFSSVAVADAAGGGGGNPSSSSSSPPRKWYYVVAAEGVGKGGDLGT